MARVLTPARLSETLELLAYDIPLDRRMSDKFLHRRANQVVARIATIDPVEIAVMSLTKKGSKT